MFLQLAVFVTLWSCIKADGCSVAPVNATGTITTPGPKINESFATSEWKISSLVFESPNADAPHVSVVRHEFELETNPPQNFSAPTFPLTGCLLIIPQTQPQSPTPNDPGTCTSLFPPACLSQIISTINTTASSLSGTPSSTNASSCSTIATQLTALNTNPDSACSSFRFRVPSYTFLSSPDAAYLPTIDSRCAPPNIVNVNANSSSTAIYKNGWTTFANAEGDYGAYDAALVTPVPVIITTWAKGGLGVQMGWADTKVICVTSGNVEKGSRGFNGSSSATAVGTSSSTATSSSVMPSKSSSGAGETFSKGIWGVLITVLGLGVGVVL